MKKILLSTAIVSVLLVGCCKPADAGMWTKLSTMGDEVIKPTNTYNVEAAGWNIRVLEWTPKDNPNIRCIFGGGSGKGGIACYPAKK